MAVELSKIQKYFLYRLWKGVEEGTQEQTLGGYAGTGKASACSALVYTPFGPKPMGEIKVGDQISNPDGTIARVIQVFPQGKQEVFRVTFVDGAETLVTKEHLWRVHFSSKKYKAEKLIDDGLTGEEIVDTEYLIAYLKSESKKSRPRWPFVPLAKPVQFTIVNNGNRFLIDAYFLGLLLGDGSFRDAMLKFSTKDKEILEYMRTRLELQINRASEGGCDYRILKSSNIQKALEKWGLWGLYSHEKFIPEHYKLAPIEIRQQLLRGLMDTDGTVDKKNNCSFCSTSHQLAKDVQWIVRSLGGKATITKKHGKYRKPDGRLIKCKTAYNVYISVPTKSDLFLLGRKRARCSDQFNGGYSILQRRITSIEPAGREECQCIKVNHPNGLYITDDFIVTHNTTIIQYLSKMLPNFGVSAYTGKAANVLRRKGVKATTIHSRIYTPIFDKGEVEFELVPSLDVDGLIIDEASMVPRDIYEDLKFFGVPLIFVGDHGQLEPIGTDFNLMGNPMYKLEEIHRNAGDIARFAQHLRLGFASRSFQPQDGSLQIIWNETLQHLVGVDQVICAYNRTRVETNNTIRQALGYKGLLNIGERVMCLRNNRELALFNGMQGTVKALYDSARGTKRMDFDFDGTHYENIRYDPRQFGQESYKFQGRPGKGAANPFDYAYCITCHKCVHPDTLTETNEGLLPIKDIAKHGMIATPTGPQKYENFVENPIGPAISIMSEHGYELTVTPDHKVEIWNGNEFHIEEACELKQHDTCRVFLGSQFPESEVVDLINDTQLYKQAKMVDIPKELTGDLAEFLGLMVADGTIWGSGFRLVKRHPEVVRRFGKLCDSLFGSPCRNIEVNGTNGKEMSSATLARWLMSLGGLLPNNKDIPQSILRSNTSIQKRFLRGLFEDGWVNSKDNNFDHIGWFTCFPELYDKVKIMLLRCGIASNTITSGQKTNLYIYGDYAKIFASEIGFISEFKQARLKNIGDCKYDMIPITSHELQGLRNIFVRDKDLTLYDYQNAKQMGHISRRKFNRLLNVLPDRDLIDVLRGREKYFYTSVSKISKTESPSMCVEVKEGHRFMQNGFPFSNSQGDEWDKVMVFEQKNQKWDHRRWAYTAASRARELLIWRIGY